MPQNPDHDRAELLDWMLAEMRPGEAGETNQAARIRARIDVLVAELATIEIWDATYLGTDAHDLIDQTSFEARQARRQQIQEDLKRLRAWDRANDKL